LLLTFDTGMGLGVKQPFQDDSFVHTDRKRRSAMSAIVYENIFSLKKYFSASGTLEGMRGFENKIQVGHRTLSHTKLAYLCVS
jgi:hypothetical protein